MRAIRAGAWVPHVPRWVVQLLICVVRAAARVFHVPARVPQAAAQVVQARPRMPNQGRGAVVCKADVKAAAIELSMIRVLSVKSMAGRPGPSLYESVAATP